MIPLQRVLTHKRALSFIFAFIATNFFSSIALAADSQTTTTTMTTTASSPGAAAAPTPPPKKPLTIEQFKAKVAEYGISFNEAHNKVDVTLNLNNTIPAIPKMEKEQVIPTLTPKVIEKMPITISVIAVGIAFTMELLEELYKNDASADKTHIDVYVTPTGATAKQLCFSFDYTRSIFTTMDLNTMAPQPFVEAVPGFTYSKWCTDAMTTEDKAMA